jgi:acyl carrier protein
LEGVFVAPRTPTEQALAEIWAQILKMEQVGVHDNFFALGGHSLMATQVVSRVRNTFQVSLPLRSLFENPTVAELARVAVDCLGEESHVGDGMISVRDFEEGRL